MGNRGQMFSVSSTREKRLRRTIVRSWGTSPANWQEIDLRQLELLCASLAHESAIEAGLAPRRVNWNSVLGIALATVFSGCVWAGVALMIVSVWR